VASPQGSSLTYSACGGAVLTYEAVIIRHRLKWMCLLSVLTSLTAATAQSQQSQTLNREFQTAVAQYDAGQYAGAAAQLERLLPRLPNSFDVHELLGLVYSAQSQDAKANEHFERAVRLKPGSAEARTNLATNLMHLGKLATAEVEFRKAVEFSPRDFEANHDLGEFYVHAGKLSKATSFLAQAQRINPASYDNGYDLSLAYLLTGRSSDARKLVNNLLKRKDSAELHNLLGEIEEKEGKFVLAANEFEAAAHTDPSESNLFDWASELLLHRTLDPAIEVFQHAAERYPKSPRLAIGLGMALYSRGNYDDAVKSLLRAADLSPSDARSYVFLSKAYDSSPSQAAEVIERFRRFADLQPQNPQAPYYYAMSLWKGKRAEDATLDISQIESLLKKAIALDPNFAEAHLQLGNLYSDQKKYAESIPEYVKALESDSGLADAHYRLAQAYIHTGQKDLAQEQLQVYQQLRAQHLAELDKQRAEIRQFVYSEKDGPLRQNDTQAVAQ
jgi:tetratricopeptide (TPR) repeat protein